MSVVNTYPTPSVNELRLSQLPLHFATDDGGELVVVEGGFQVPFSIKRIFTVRAAIKATRGGHAHRLCAQFMICTQGAIEINCDDGKEQRTFLLDRGDVGLLVPPKIWATQRFCRKN